MKSFLQSSGLLLSLVGCTSAGDRAAWHRIELALDQMRCSLSGEGNGVMETEPVGEGHGVVLYAEKDGARTGDTYIFWVKDEQVFAVNEAAAACAPTVRAAPAEITEERVLEAIGNYR